MIIKGEIIPPEGFLQDMPAARILGRAVESGSLLHTVLERRSGFFLFFFLLKMETDEQKWAG